MNAAIDRKRISLEGVLVPVTAARNGDFLRDAGFRDVECFWRCLNLAAWFAIKPRVSADIPLQQSPR